jgi:hypothetical protein
MMKRRLFYFTGQRRMPTMLAISYLPFEQAAAYVQNVQTVPQTFLVESRDDREKVIEYVPADSAYKNVVGEK